ncbi:hypothetical protein IWW55_001892 [Coemansia sp. RSA 2706]|nr:hypothetical protein LPJ70_001389 [Coemansia sp. RSA 2708]KAJ2304301.1 hypothetical protein IWW54_005451 [Coemansia sp. RSA 2705]KAJ2305511.1 hypothetical protein IWW55_001892 [Coemansia sp. RSA 2706]KAJ2311125.1 hypothetical protein IWW52_005219 [Coemansia sp. RSA 2704]KAJ2328248.1 hypothetical protein IWW51_001299 [Coemansia sp. RSA 2702]KAJ2733354.1 hypothetical protein H4R23_002630 [Coemansia sp. Cherry 401B]
MADEHSEADAAAQAYLCPICLHAPADPAFTDACFHQFCFVCIVQWLEHSPRCPLCNRHTGAVVQQTASGRIARTRIAQPQPQAPRRTYGRRQQTTVQGSRKREAVYAHRLTRISPPTRTYVSQTPRLLRAAIATQRCHEWIRRDLQAALLTDDVCMLEALVVALIREHGSVDALAAAPSFRQLLGDRARMFAEELAAFVDSSLDMRSYDVYIAYDTRNLN